MKKRRWVHLFMVGAAALSLALAGCGSDGSDGAQGPKGDQGEKGDQGDPGAPGAPGQDATAAIDVETCVVCHNDIESTHAVSEFTVENVEGTLNGDGTLDIDFDVLVNGVGSDGYTLRRVYVHYDDPSQQTDPPTLLTTFVRDQIYRYTNDPPGDVTLTYNGAGNYTATIAAADVVDDATYMVNLRTDMDGSEPSAVFKYGVSPLRDLVTNSGCASCHGAYPAWSEKFDHYAVGGAECQICHSRVGRTTTFISKDAAGDFVQVGSFDGTNLTEYIHGIHNSHNMPDGVYYRTTAPDDSFDNEDRYAVGYPSDMRNCVVCHETEDQLAAASAAPVSYYLCMTCHNNWDGFVHVHDDPDGNYEAGDLIIPVSGPNLSFHRGFGADRNCMTNCHAEDEDIDEVADFHNDFQGSDAHYNSFYRGEDISYSNPNEVSFAITGVTSDGSSVSFTWIAENADGAVDPCNTDIEAGPTFQALRAYLAYAKGDDWVNEFVGSSPGQPSGTTSLFPNNTTCDANVATTTGLTLDADATYAQKVLLAIGGKPLDMHADAGEAFFVRVASPTYAFDPADGTAATARRDAVANEKCLSCHRGTLYQHGGDRVDNEQLCVVCHNPSSSDKNVRADFYEIVNPDGTVNTDATYDGLASQTYDMRYMIHSIHGVSKRDAPWVIYRSRGIYSFVTDAMEMPAGWPLDGVTVDGCLSTGIRSNGDPNCEITHNWTVVHYPRPVNLCEACHNEEAYEVPDQTQAVSLTVDAGGPGADWSDQTDDIVIGPAAGACTACHYTVPTRVHATVDFGYMGNVTKDEMLDKAAP